MLEKPSIDEKTIFSCLENSYGIQPESINFLPLGNNPDTWVYKISSGKDNYFLKLKRGEVYEPSVSLPNYLNNQGIKEVFSPIETKAKNLWVKVSNYSIVLYPFVEGTTAMKSGMSDEQWIEFGLTLKRLHETHLPSSLLKQVQEENFLPKWSGLIRDIQRKVQRDRHLNSFEVGFVEYWKEKDIEINQILERTEEIGQYLKNKPHDFVLCHTDIHTDNILLDKENMYLVDWDTPLMAPKERDLMFVEGSEKAQLFYKGYGAVVIDRPVLAYYRYEWVVQEIGDYGQRIFLSKDAGKETLEHAFRSFTELFEPGNVVETAYQSDNVKIPK